MILNDVTVAFAVQHADFFKSLGQNDVWLGDDEGAPWELADRCEPGGSHRMDIATSVRFSGKHACGLRFSWHFDIETRDANGSSEYKINTAAILAVIQRMPDMVADQFRAYLKDCAEKVEKRGKEYMDSAQRQYGTAAQLRSVANG